MIAVTVFNGLAIPDITAFFFGALDTCTIVACLPWDASVYQIVAYPEP